MGFEDTEDGLDYFRTTQIIRALKKIGVQDKETEDGELCLHYAARYRRPDSLRAFLDEFPCDINVHGSHGISVLCRAARSEHSDNVRILLEAGADPARYQNPFNSPLSHAIDERRFDNARVLIDTGVYSESFLKSILKKRPKDKYHANVKAYFMSFLALQSINATNCNASPKSL